MQLIELVYKKDLIETKIKELCVILQSNHSDEIAEKLYGLLNEKQNITMQLHRVNITSKISIGSAEIDVASAITVRDTMLKKINIITSLINNLSCELDKLELQKQRDAIHAEYSILANEITKNDLMVSVDYKEDNDEVRQI